MVPKKRSKVEIEIARLRDDLLEKCIARDLEGAKAALLEVRLLGDMGKIPEKYLKEYNCRILESELDIAAVEAKPIPCLVNVLQKISVSNDFSETRRIEILQRGLSSIGRLAR